MSNLYSGQTQMAMSPMYGMGQPRQPMIPGGSFDPYGGMGGFGGGMGNYSMFGSYNSMPDYTGGYMPGFGQQLPSQFGYGQGGYASQFGGGMGGGFGMPQMQQPNVNDMFGQYMFGQYYGAPSFNPFQQTSMFGGGGRRGFGQQPGRQQMQQASPFEGLELDIDALRAALGLSGQAPASPTAQITPSGDMSRGAAQAPAAPAAPPMVPPAAPTQAQAQTGTGGGGSRTFTGPNALMDAFKEREQRLGGASAPTPSPVQIPPNLNLFVPGFAGLDQGAGRQVQEPVVTSGIAPPPVPVAPEMGGRFYIEPQFETITVQPQPVPSMPAPVAPPPQMAAPVAPPRAPAFSKSATTDLLAARQAAQNARTRGRG